MAVRGIAQGLSPAHRRWLFLNTGVVAALINAMLSALIAWLAAANVDQVPLWAIPLIDGPSVITDTVGTLFILPLLTTAAIAATVRRDLRTGRLTLTARGKPHPLLERLPRGTWARGAVFGAICMAILGPPAVVALVALNYGDIGVGEFVVYKAIFGAALGAFVTPLIALAAFADQARSSA